MVSNNDLHELIKSFQADFNQRCDDLTKRNDEGRLELLGKIEQFGKQFEQINQRLDNLEQKNIAYDQKLTEVDETKSKEIEAHEFRIAALEDQLRTFQEEDTI